MNRTAWIILAVSVLAIVVTIVVMKKKNGTTTTNGTTNGNGATSNGEDGLADNTTTPTSPATELEDDVDSLGTA